MISHFISLHDDYVNIYNLIKIYYFEQLYFAVFHIKN